MVSSLRGKTTTRSLYLTGMGLIYTCAFVSFWLQFPGLLGSNGLLPASSFWRKLKAEHQGFSKLPCWLWFFDDDDASVDAVLEGTALVGIGGGMLCILGVHHALLFVILHGCYLTLYTVSQTWLGFQWDIFLLETGFATILYAPVFTVSARGQLSGGHPMAWPLRALWVKFMVMSGVVKVTADCPTWQQLTALEFHFASTCLPTSEAWWFHSLPPFLLRVGTAVMFLVELVAPWFLLAPITSMRRVGVLVQLPMQALIQYTGNYNWFNLHTCILLLPAWACDFGENNPWERFWSRRGCKKAVVVSSCISLFHAFTLLFPISLSRPYRTLLSRPDGFTIGNKADRYMVAGMLDAVLGWRPFFYVYFCSALAGSDFARRSSARKGLFRGSLVYVFNIVLTAMALAHLGVILLPLKELGNRPILPLIPTPTGRRLTQVWKEKVDPFRVSNSYGLFRRMTGVAEVPRGLRNSGRGYAGLKPSMVAVPAVVLEASVNGTIWREIPFRYAPFSEERAPRRTAPHQPRLDWQMWFAALGHYQHNPWLLHLMYRIVTRVPATDVTLQLLDVDAYPFPETPPAFVRASLYHYDFTRSETRWARAIPGTEICGANCSKYWTRTFVKEYVPKVDATVLRMQVVEPAQWPVDPVGPAEGAVTRLRRFVGVTYEGYFFDGPLLCICIAVLLPALRARLPGMRTRVVRGPPGHLKAE